jgi:Tol biopolymer transport system component
VPGDTNGYDDAFVRDRRTGRTERVSVGTGGVEGNDRSGTEALSTDGRFVAFGSWADNLVPGDTNEAFDVFIRDRQTGRTERVSVGTGGVEGDDRSGTVALSADGRFVAFGSWADNLVPGDTNGNADVFVRDRRTGVTERASVGPNGVQGNGDSGSYATVVLSADGRFVAFQSSASNLVPGDTNGLDDIFVRDRLKGVTERVSLGPNGVQGNDGSSSPALSADGRFVAFGSWADNLVPGDTNEEEDVFVHAR